MPFICEDVGTTKRGRMTPTRALKAWERTGGVCVNCGLKIDGTKADWFAEHIRALELGGSDTDDNLGPAHWACKRDKDAADHASAAKAKRNKRAERRMNALRHVGDIWGNLFPARSLRPLPAP